MRLLTIFCLLFSFGLMAKDYKSLQRLKEGDVISAEVFNDIMDRIELTLKPITISELAGTWAAKQYICNQGVYGNANFCDLSGYFNTTNENGVFEVRTDTVTITDNGNNTFNWTSPNKQFFYHGNIIGSLQGLEIGNLNHTCSLSPYGLIGCLFDTSLRNTNGVPLPGDRIVTYSNIKKTSPTQLVLFWGPRNGGGSLSQIILDKLNNPPEPPTNLAVTNADGTVSLSWTAPETYTLTTLGAEGTTPASQTEGVVSSYKIQSKDAADGTYTDLATATTNSYTDTITSGTTRWYRVYAVNEYGTSKGSNVVSISYSE